MNAPVRRFVVLTPGVMGLGGIAEVSRLVVRALVPRDGEREAAGVDVVSLTDASGRGPADPRQVRFLPCGGRRPWFVAAALRAGLRHGRRAAVVCLHLHLSPLAALIAAPARLAVFVHGIEAWRRVTALERLALERAALLIADSEHAARRFREANPDFRDRPIAVCHPAVRERAQTRAEGAPPETGAPATPFALIVGRMAAAERYKGHDLLIDLWPRVLTAVSTARLVVAGEGDDRGRLRSRAAHLGDRVAFVGAVDDAALDRLYGQCAFFVMPSRDEGFGLVFLEAMRAGKACIGGVGAAEEIIEHGVTGLVVDPRQADQVLDAVIDLFREPERRERMGRAGAARVAAGFTEAQFRQRLRLLLGVGA